MTSTASVPAASDSGAPTAAPDGTASGGFDPGDWASVRDQFALRRDLAHFSAFVLASMLRPVADAVDRHRRGLDEDTSAYLEDNEVTLESAVLDAAASYLGAQTGELALTDSTTMGLGLVYGGLQLRPDQHILTTEHDFYSTHEALRLVADGSGATVSRVGLYDDPADASAEQIVDRLMAGVRPATRVVAVTWVHSGTGVKLPIAQLSAAWPSATPAATRPTARCWRVDAVHALGVEDATVGDLGCDVLVSGTHKWLFGPRGTGVVWARRSAWTTIDWVIPPFDPATFQAWIDGVAPTRTLGGVTRTPGGFHTFEYRWALREAFGFHLDIGQAAVAQRTHSQASQLKDGLAGLGGLRVVTPTSPQLSAGIVCFQLESLDPFGAVTDLRAAGYGAGLTPYATGYVRVGPSIVTTPEEVDGLTDAIADLL